MKYKKVGFLGLGLIGGSLAKALKLYDKNIEIIATTRREETVQKAYWDGLITNSALLQPEDFHDCDIIFLCAPVKDNIDYLKSLKEVVGTQTLITDVGSVKKPIMDEAERLGLSEQFIGAHPMTGKEVGGYDVSDPDILNNAPYIIVSEHDVDKDFLNIITEAFHSRLIFMTADEHDRAVAVISHVPHIIASSLVHLAVDSDNDDNVLQQICAGGFKDITRIASSGPALWQGIIFENKKQVLDMIDSYSKELELYKNAIENDDVEGLMRLMSESKKYRDSIR